MIWPFKRKPLSPWVAEMVALLDEEPLAWTMSTGEMEGPYTRKYIRTHSSGLQVGLSQTLTMRSGISESAVVRASSSNEWLPLDGRDEEAVIKAVHRRDKYEKNHVGQGIALKTRSVRAAR